VNHGTLWVLGLAMVGGAVLSGTALARCVLQEDIPPAPCQFLPSGLAGPETGSAAN